MSDTGLEQRDRIVVAALGLASGAFAGAVVGMLVNWRVEERMDRLERATTLETDVLFDQLKAAEANARADLNKAVTSLADRLDDVEDWRRSLPAPRTGLAAELELEERAAIERRLAALEGRASMVRR
jgi:hypothetical protein